MNHDHSQSQNSNELGPCLQLTNKLDWILFLHVEVKILRPINITKITRSRFQLFIHDMYYGTSEINNSLSKDS
jgi:hypothetical protein